MKKILLALAFLFLVYMSSRSQLTLVEVFIIDNCDSCQVLLPTIQDTDSTTVIVWHCGKKETPVCRMRRICSGLTTYPFVKTTIPDNQARIHLRKERGKIKAVLESNGGHLWVIPTDYTNKGRKCLRIEIIQGIDYFEYIPQVGDKKLILFIEGYGSNGMEYVSQFDLNQPRVAVIK